MDTIITTTMDTTTLATMDTVGITAIIEFVCLMHWRASARGSTS